MQEHLQEYLSWTADPSGESKEAAVAPTTFPGEEIETGIVAGGVREHQQDQGYLLAVWTAVESSPRGLPEAATRLSPSHGSGGYLPGSVW